MFPQSGEPCVPLGADARHPVHRRRERSRRQLVPRLASLASALDEPCFVERGQVLRHCLPCHWELGGELCRRRGLAPGERLDHTARRFPRRPSRGRVAHPAPPPPPWRVAPRRRPSERLPRRPPAGRVRRRWRTIPRAAPDPSAPPRPRPVGLGKRSRASLPRLLQSATVRLRILGATKRLHFTQGAD
jgi:hypothetical protein